MYLSTVVIQMELLEMFLHGFSLLLVLILSYFQVGGTTLISNHPPKAF